ncbi:hypothetical protein DESC_120173 [Desulfosarcina cetonica]|nr:hypothetical protein DESC_120173 [Desulfosarcina cetonica]
MCLVAQWLAGRSFAPTMAAKTAAREPPGRPSFAKNDKIRHDTIILDDAL